ncbi:MAG TPA: hypothetical protein PK264_08735 [Hyphomicrobiaceae bacterium]|nr:hypothetical protein [Hyphomicrobiaceae bacterium]
MTHVCADASCRHDLDFHASDDRPSRRRALILGGSAAAIGGGLVTATTGASAQVGDQSSWRFCNKCFTLFFDGYPTKGSCPAGGGHVAQGYIFNLHHDVRKQPPRVTGRFAWQYDWRFCNKCFAMFFDGYPAKGRCPAGGGHVAQGFNFGLDFTNESQRRPPVGVFQTTWRFCGKCNGMFFDGYPTKGRCQGGGAHAAAGWMFHLAFTAGPATPPPPPPGTGAGLGNAIVAFARARLNQCVDTRLQTRPQACPALAPGAVGDGECTHLVQAALASVGARAPTFQPGNYVWGNVITGGYQPGDIIQFYNARFNGPNSWWQTATQHTAIIEVMRSATAVTLLHQNSPIRAVTRQDLDLAWPHTGRFVVFRAVRA